MTKYENLVASNEACEQKLIKVLQPKNLLLTQAPMAVFDEPTKSELQAFVHVRCFPSVQKTADWPRELAQDWPPKKGKFSDISKGDTTHCLIRMADDCKAKPILLQKPKQIAASNSQQEQLSQRHLGATIVRSSQSRFAASRSILASSLMQMESFRSLAQNIFGLDVTTDHAMQVQADHLQGMLATRLDWLVNESQRVKAHNKSNWCWSFQAKRLGYMSALFTMAGMVVNDLHCFGAADCLLADPSQFELVTLGIRKDGAYYYWDSNRREWVRAGMVASVDDRDMHSRHLEHEKGSKLQAPEHWKSEFYTSYPFKGDKDPSSFSCGRRGFFESLQQYVGLGVALPPQSDSFHTNLATQTRVLAQMFNITFAETQNIKKMNKKLTPVENQRRAIHYMLECACGLLLSPSSNISSNPGWEQALKQYN
ncbi:expressed unknown protein [Seminavis robusta]|uniref:Uncharacterized protein n=1 Tax=Seminavis robusta TaxID=568900 RepID=A0A9N8F308_9STRA|nr:expressed unknown protein [Seminavis robusta]|eukprot:Sro2943_g340721.1  (425) ;mRNA; f:1961-3235